MTEEEKLRTVRITNIQRFCMHDGPGIRTTVFLKGCSIHCPWCCNPENISYEIQQWRDPETGETGIYGCDISLEDLEKELLKDRDFYLDGGGVTFSGGEPLLQIEKYEPLLRELKAEKVHLAVETALFVDRVFVEMALPYIDWWYVDLKLLRSKMCKDILGGDITQYLENLNAVAKSRPEVHVRIPCVHGITDKPENMERIGDCLRKLPICDAEVFGVHSLAINKYRSLDINYEVDTTRSDAGVAAVKNKLEDRGIRCHTIRL